MVNQNFRPNERELVKIVTFFKRQSKKLIAEGKLGEEHAAIEQTVDRFLEQIEVHANTRSLILEQRMHLNKLVKDNAECPRCHTKDMIKLVGSETNEKGWKSNRYKCRKCNIRFTWNTPNNPWDMIEYIKDIVQTFQSRYEDPSTPEEQKEALAEGISNTQLNLDKLLPVIEAHDQEFKALQERDLEMERLIHEFKNTLLIEKIKMDIWENKKKSEGNK